MKIIYQETTADLLKRINIHDKYGSRNIDQWMVNILPLQKGMKILDVSCGSGKQCFSFYDHLEGDCDITGGDISQELLNQARKENENYHDHIKFVELDFNRTFQFPVNTFDLLSCCFAIYYSENIPFTIKEMHRVLKPGGILFTTGPMPENKRFFYDVIKEATGRPIPPMPGNSRYGSEILSTINNVFPEVNVQIFENPLTFNEVDPFIQYTRASLSEDRKLWTDLFQNKAEFEDIMQKIQTVAKRRLKENGKLIMTKVVGGFIARK